MDATEVPSLTWGSPVPVHMRVTVFHEPADFISIWWLGPGVASFVISAIICSSDIGAVPALEALALVWAGSAAVAAAVARQQPSSAVKTENRADIVEARIVRLLATGRG